MKKIVIAKGLSPEAARTLKQLDVDMLEFDANPAIDSKIAHHSDLSFLYDGNDTLFVAKEMAYCSDILKNFVNNIIVIPESLGNSYPDDVKLNCVVTGNTLICNIDTVSETVLEYFKRKNYRIINVKQGYTKCSVLTVASNAIITDDPSIAHACYENGFDVLKVSKGCVRLDGYDYGFIGGASGKISADTVVFCGNPDSHGDASAIKEFMNKYKINSVSLDNDQLYDIGGIIPIYGG